MPTKTTFNEALSSERKEPQSMPLPSGHKWPTVSVIIPTLNEAKNLPYILPYIPKWVHEVIIVDGRSKDDTVAVARQLLPSARIVLETRKGKGAALRRGFQEATGEIIAMLDADGSMLPREIYSYVSALLVGADFVKGSRFLQGGGTDDMSFIRALGNFGLTQMVNLLFGSRYSDLCYGYCAFWRRHLGALSLESDGFEIETEMNIHAIRADLKIAEIPSFEYDRIFGESNLNTWRDGWRVFKTILREFSAHRLRRKPLVKAASAQASVIQSDPIVEAIQLLSREARHLVNMRHTMKPDLYERAVDALKEACWTILTDNRDHPQVQVINLPSRYHELDLMGLFAQRVELVS